MFQERSLNRADIATDVAIPLLADGGWHAMTLRSLGRSANVSGAAVAGWFGTTAVLHEAVARRFGARWLRSLDARVAGVCRGKAPLSRADIISTLLPTEWEEEVFHRIWLSIVEAGQWEANVAVAVAEVEAAEHALVLEMLERDLAEVTGAPEGLWLEATALVALVRGLRQARCSVTQPMPRDTADQAAACVNAWS